MLNAQLVTKKENAIVLIAFKNPNLLLELRKQGITHTYGCVGMGK